MTLVKDSRCRRFSLDLSNSLSKLQSLKSSVSLIYTYIQTCIYIYLYVYLFIYIGVHVCMCIHTYAYIHTHIGMCGFFCFLFLFCSQKWLCKFPPDVGGLFGSCSQWPLKMFVL